MTSTLSIPQDKALSIIPCFTSLLSCLGSAQIIYKVSTARKTTPYRRILWGLSSADFLCSLLYPWQAFLVPADTSPRIWAIGNDATCTLLGFGQQIFFASIGYNSCLSIYFLLTVKMGMSNAMVAKRYEPLMHIVCVGYPLVTAIVGAAMGMFHEVELSHGCWVQEYPKGCDDEEQNSTCIHGTIALFFGGIPAIVAFFIILFNNLLVYGHVKYTIQKSRRRFASSLGGSSSAMSRPLRSSLLSMGASMIRRTQSREQQEPPTRDPQVQRVHAVFTQAFMYVMAFLIVYSPSFILRILSAHGYGAEEEGKLFPLLLLQAIFLPSQGFFNLLVYIRPTYKRTRRENADESRWWAFRRALYGEKVKPSKHGSSDFQHRRRAASSSSDFGMMVVRPEARRMDESSRQRSLLRKYGLDNNQYPVYLDESSKNNDISNNNPANNQNLDLIQEDSSSTMTFATGSVIDVRNSYPVTTSSTRASMPDAMTTTASTIAEEGEDGEEGEDEDDEMGQDQPASLDDDDYGNVIKDANHPDDNITKERLEDEQQQQQESSNAP
ncbi:expressed unknown protein [Seminavis robusta]|uniref:G-protein coupled receptors family 1 profile domain-containing protein n=1 Tax=Seminavis robusta TaxID=568900 RepID=A0A9N8DT24_9STRA|nr:expressed unknown protein [Seminavis robusta]|eukprot:Sro268_g103660.1 n/a (552) ;mRNA; r:31738-33488